RVLAVIDDHAEMRNLVRLLFERAGASVDTDAPTVTEALPRIDPEGDGIIVLDHNLDDEVTGLDGARLLRARAPAARIVLFTGAVTDADDLADAGVDAVVPKDRILQLVSVGRDLLAGEGGEPSRLDALL